MEIEFDSEVARRRRAVELVADGVSKAEAGRRLGRSRQWVDKWGKRYSADGDAGLEDRSRAPHQTPTKTPDRVVAKVLAVRDDLEANPVASIGGLTILAEMERDRFTPIPSVATIERILQRHDRTRPRRKKQRSGVPLPLPQVTTPGVWQQTDWVQDQWLTGGIRFNSIQLGDVGSQGIASAQYPDRTLVSAVTFLLERAWPALSVPQAISVDNSFSATTHRNNPFTSWVRACLYFGTEVIVCPPGGLGWNNHAEAVNNTWQARTIAVSHFTSIEELRAGSDVAVDWLNTRRPILDPDECGTRYAADYIAAHADTLRWPPPLRIADYLDPKGRLRLPLPNGRITFIRHVTEQHTVRVANVHWPTPHTIPVGALVIATLTTKNRKLEIRRNGTTVTTYDYPIATPTIDPYYPPADTSLLNHV